MNQNRNRRKHKKEDKKQNKVIRCKALNRPVFEHETCSKFSTKINSNNQKNCVNCSHAF
jgi:hypothetical protein